MARAAINLTLALALELVNVSDLVKESGFKVFLEQLQQEVQSSLANSWLAAMMHVKPGGDLFKEAWSWRKVWHIFVRDGEIDTIARLKTTNWSSETIISRTGATSGHLLLFERVQRLINSWSIAASYHWSRKLALLWVTDFMRLNETSREALSPIHCASSRWRKRPQTARAQAYDLIFNGLKLAAVLIDLFKSRYLKRSDFPGGSTE